MAEKRTFLGETPEERQRRRRGELIDAVLDVVHEGGASAVGVRAVISRANLASRYFYESFASTDELLTAAVQEVVEEVLVVGIGALHAPAVDPSTAGDAELLEHFRAGVSAALTHLSQDPRRLSLLSAAFSHGLAERLQRDLTSLVAATIQGEEGADVVGFDAASTLFAAGGMVSLALAHVAGRLPLDHDAVVDRLALFTLAVIRTGAPAPRT
ncbi:MAG: TetR family transcriptional regulator [Propionibacteriales bacterium]|nr:TetR family transcriptional regulator [Propionibacteriales bacterium]